MQRQIFNIPHTELSRHAFVRIKNWIYLDISLTICLNVVYSIEMINH